MVKICSLHQYQESTTNMSSFFEKYSYDLHIFQKWALEAIVQGNHVLVTAPTGSGKTMPGEFAIDFFHSIGKKVIYTTPVKALSNQKFYDFTKKYPHISIGLITGDIKTNPDADVLIMTTEILLNKLYSTRSEMKDRRPTTSFEMDVETELGCVIFDEIHMINDQNRGHVWEQSILLLPKHIQMIGLSATLDNPEKFAMWMETRGESKSTSTDKVVVLASKKDRPVPLTHYSFITVNSDIYKAIKDKTIQAEIKETVNKPFVLVTAKGEYKEEQYHKTHKMLKLFRNNKVFVTRQHVINQVSKYLVEHEMMPALCYVFSRKQLEICAKEVTTNLLEFDSKIPYIVEHESQQIIRKLPNHEEYFQLKEYTNLMSLLKKGIAIHHAGMLPILREIVELFFTKGYVKLLFCTETIAIGLNLPVKTVVFTDVNKFDGNGMRTLFSHEYTQAAGRAGRLGLDAVGHVIHLNNIFRDISNLEYRQLTNGKPQTLVSKFKISYNMLLSLISIGDHAFVDFSRKSMIQGDIDSQLDVVLKEMNQVQKKIDLFVINVLPQFPNFIDVLNEYIDLQSKEKGSTNKKKREIQRKIENIVSSHKNIDSYVKNYVVYTDQLKSYKSLQNQYKSIEQFIDSNVDVIINLLKANDFFNSSDKLTTKGISASQIHEVHCLLFADLLDSNFFNDMTSIELVGVLSCFVHISVSDADRCYTPDTGNPFLDSKIINVHQQFKQYQQIEDDNLIHTGTDSNFTFDVACYAMRWCNCHSILECNELLREMELDKGIFLGEFVKAILKINNIASEIENVCELTGNIALLSRLKEIPAKTLKYVITSQSLYI